MHIASTWNSLEVAKLVVAAAIPIVVVVLGVLVSRGARRLEHAEWTNRTLIQRRLDVYDQMFTPLNDLYVFARCVGHFRDISPPQSIERKRDADTLFHRNKFLLSGECQQAYTDFMETCFKTYVGPGRNPQLRASRSWHRRERPQWDDAWDVLYVSNDDDVRSAGTFTAAYEALMFCFGREIGVSSQPK